MSYDPFSRYKKNFTLDQKNSLNFVQPAIGMSKKVFEQRAEEKANVSTQNYVALPRHLFTPEGARSVDIRNLASIPAGNTFDILVFTAPEGSTVFFTHYAIFDDALSFNLVEFVPTVNNRRIYPFHGEPSNGFKIALGLAPDLSNNSLIEGPIQVNPGETLKWTVVNNDAVAVVMGVRMKGYVDATTSRTNRVFGG